MHGKCFKTIVTETMAIYLFFNHSGMTPFSAYPSQQIRIAREPQNIGRGQDRVWSRLSSKNQTYEFLGSNNQPDILRYRAGCAPGRLQRGLDVQWLVPHPWDVTLSSRPAHAHTHARTHATIVYSCKDQS
jgi:hypothetical protein